MRFPDLQEICTANVFMIFMQTSCSVQWSRYQAKLALLLEYPSKKQNDICSTKICLYQTFAAWFRCFKYQSKIFFESHLGSHSLILNKFGKSVDRFWHADKDQTNWPKKALHCAQPLKVRASRQASSSPLAFFFCCK